MKKILFFIFCIISMIGNAQQLDLGNKFYIVDAGTSEPVPYAFVSISTAKQVITAEANGVFYIQGDLAAMRDTISFDAQTYDPLKVPLNKLATMNTIRLTKAAFKSAESKPEYSQKRVLNNYIPGDVSYYAGVASDDAPFDYLQIAQRFTTDTSKCKLASVDIVKIKDWLPTKFRLRIYDADTITGAPGANICNEVINQANDDDVDAFRTGNYRSYLYTNEVNINLKSYNIIIPNKVFYVAIEWLRVLPNASPAPIYNKVTKAMNNVMVFRPFIGISPVNGAALNIWVMELDRKWKTYDHFLPFGTDLAIRATVEY